MGQRAFEVAMGMRGYAGSAAEREDRLERTTVRKTKVGRGHYLISRDDGYSIEVRRSAHGYWYQTGSLARRKTLAAFVYDMASKYMARDLV